MKPAIAYTVAQTTSDFEQARRLFTEYASALGIDLSFQNFAEELKAIHLQYNKPTGGIWLAQIDETCVGCVGVRKMDKEIAELKRMYVKSECRGNGIGVELLKRSLRLATELAYKKIRLDTLPSMTKAIELYQAFGFYTIPPYRYNPFADAIYMEKIL